jgi:hypothetical protein
MSKFTTGLLILLGSVLVAGIVWAAQVGSDEYRKAYGQYGRSDGLYQRLDNNNFDMMINGQRLQTYGKGFYEDFTDYQDGDMPCFQNDWTACSGTNTEINWIWFPSGNKFVNSVNGTCTTGCIDMDAGSLDIAGDQVNDEGMELTRFWLDGGGTPFVVGEDPAFYTCAKFSVADVSGSDAFVIGFREVEAFQTADYTAYQEIAVLGWDAAANPADIDITTSVASTETTTDTTNNMADGTTDTWCVYVSAAGVLTYTIDGSPPFTTAAATITDGTWFIPFISIRQSANLTGEVDLLEWEAGYQ